MFSCAVCRKEFRKEELIVYGRKSYFLCSPCKSDLNRLERFGLTPADYKFLLAFQNNCCAICERRLQLTQHNFAVDHCHDSDDVRGILCKRCNTALGIFQDDPDFLVRAAEYVNHPPAVGRITRHNGRKKVSFLREEYAKRYGNGNS
jgi:hypothetical protein